MKHWLVEIKSKPGGIEKFLNLLGIKPMTTCESSIIEAETLKKAIEKSGRNPAKFSFTGKEATIEEIRSTFF